MYIYMYNYVFANAILIFASAIAVSSGPSEISIPRNRLTYFI